MGTWAFNPSYDIRIERKNPKAGTPGQPATIAYQLRTLSEFQGLLATTNTSSQATITLNDPTGAVMDVVNPQAMDAITVRLRNRRGVWAGAWAGYLDECREIHDPSAGRTVTLKCRGPYKRWEVGRQSAGDVLALAMAGMRNVAGAEVVRYSARAVGYNPANITFDPVADSGTGLYPSIAQSTMANPDQQTWSAPVQQMLASSGLEFFFNEDGYGHYRRVGFLGSGQKYIFQIALEDVLHADLGNGDTGLVTSVEVRWGPFPTTQTAARATAPQSMVDHLGSRPLVSTAPWILGGPGSGQVPAGAQFLADTLLDQYASGAATASVIVIADPDQYRVGTLVDMPGVRKGRGVTRYYISSCTFLCQWGGQWVQTLGLNYGRAPGNRFPYLEYVAYPVLTADPRYGPQSNIPFLAFDSTNNAKVTTPLTVQAQRGLAPNQASSSSLPVGTGIELRQTVSGGGQWVGPSHQYTVVAAPQGQDPGVIGLQSGSGTAYATIITLGSGDNGSATGTGDGSTTTTSLIQGPPTQAQGTASNGQPVRTTLALDGPPTTLAQRALAAALTHNGAPYQTFHAGPVHFDCSGLVAAAFGTVGFPLVTQNNWSNDGENGDKGVNGGPDGEFYYFLAHGAVERPSVDDAQPGDLIFCFEAGQSQRGFSHIAFLLRPGVSFGGNSPTLGVGPIAIAGFHSDAGPPFNRALDMSHIHL